MRWRRDGWILAVELWGKEKKGLRLRGEGVGLELAYDALNPR